MTSRWTDHWLRLIDDGAPKSVRRLNQASALMRSGRVSDVRVGVGAATGRVQGSSATPLAVTIAVPLLDDEAWGRVAAALARQVRHRARLLAGQVPDALEGELEAVGVSLLPQREAFDTECRCDDPSPVCAHVAAVWLAVAELLEEDPFVLLRLRGRGRERLLAAVADLHGSSDAAASRGVEPAALAGSPWTAVTIDLEDLEPMPGEAPRTPAAALRLLGDPPGWAGGMSAGDLFAPLVGRAADWATGAGAGEEAGNG